MAFSKQVDNKSFAFFLVGIFFLYPILSFAQIKRGQTPEVPLAEIKIKKSKVVVKAPKPTISDAELAKLKQRLPEYETYFWNLIRNSKNPDDFRAYLKMFPNGRYALQAKEKIAQIENEREEAQKQQSKKRCAMEEYGRKPAQGAFWNQYCMEFMLMPAGSLFMGTSFGDPDETPAHLVKINSFYMGRTEVTQGVWRQVMESNPSYFKAPEPSALKGQLPVLSELMKVFLPVESITWEDAQEFVDRLNQLDDGYYYRLPTEAEWEYASGSNLDIGNSIIQQTLDGNAWYGNNSGTNYIDAGAIWKNEKDNYTKRLTDNGNKTHQVMKKKQNLYGLYDMQGNVWEWCEDYYQPTYVGAPTDGSEIKLKNSQNLRVIRGGSWYGDARSLRVTNRMYYPQDQGGSTIGLRVVAISKLQMLQLKQTN